VAFISLKNLFDAIRGRYNDEPNLVQVTGSDMEYYGAVIGDRPDANTVSKGATFTIVDDKLDQNWISDGTNWREV